MKGVILAGGLGARLRPLTKVTNKHLLPVYDRPMVYYPLQALVNAGITQILLVTGGESAGDFLRLLENGEEFGCSLRYAYQRGEGGIAAALGLAREFAADEPVAVALGDNLVEKSLWPARRAFEAQEGGAHLLLKEVADPGRFGVPVFADGRIVRIEEKPAAPASQFAVTGYYFYDATVFDKIAACRPSARQELEITDVNNLYIAEQRLGYTVLDGWWSDAGTFDSLLQAQQRVAAGGANHPAPPEAEPTHASH